MNVEARLDVLNIQQMITGVKLPVRANKRAGRTREVATGGVKD
jgi:hypothetical protein